MLFHCWNEVSHCLEYIIHNIPAMNTLYALTLSTCRIIFRKYAFFCLCTSIINCLTYKLEVAGEILVCHTLKMYERKDTFQVNVACSIQRIRHWVMVHIHATTAPILRELLQEMCQQWTGNNVNVKLKQPPIFALLALEKCHRNINVRGNEHALGNSAKLMVLFCETFYKWHIPWMYIVFNATLSK